MLNGLKNISRYGASVRLSKSINRSIFITNVTALILIGGLSVLWVVHTLYYGLGRPSLVVAGVILICIPILLLNRNGYYTLSRYLLNINIVYGMLCMTIFRKLDGETFESTYFVSRTAIMVFAVAIPAALFHFNERKSILINVAIGSIALILYDPIHSLFGVGYYQTGNTQADYYYNTFLFTLLLFVLGLILFYLKMNLEKYETKYEETIRTLSDQNKKIGKQRTELSQKNTLLIELINEKDQDLLSINQELVRQNNDLLQFSYAISHNVRGPVASIMGVMNLIEGGIIKKEEMPGLLKNFSESVHLLDGILHKLNQILAARDDTFNIREEVNLKTELRIIEETFAKPIHDNHVKIRADLKAETLISVRAYIHSILTQLISNGIQFRSLSRQPVITVSSYYQGSSIVLRVEDNGAGINLERHREDVFKPFKRFHATASGKGIGLYLVKLQVDKLEGSIDIKSVPNVGSSITICLENDVKLN